MSWREPRKGYLHPTIERLHLARRLTRAVAVLSATGFAAARAVAPGGGTQ